MKQAFDWLRGYWGKFVRLLFADRNEDRRIENQSAEIIEDIGKPPVNRIYYGIPGKVFNGYIDRGRIIKTDDNWPFSRS